MSNAKANNKFFLISFIPAMAYWYLESNYSLKIALIGGLGLACLEILIEKIFFKKVHQIAKLNFFLILFLGGLSLLGEDGLWFKLQPFFGSMVLGSFLFYKNRKGEGVLHPMMVELGQDNIPREIIMGMERHFIIFLYFHALIMGAIALWTSTETWLFWKTIGFYIIFAGFMLIEIPIIRKRLKQVMVMKQYNQGLETL